MCVRERKTEKMSETKKIRTMLSGSERRRGGTKTEVEQKETKKTKMYNTLYGRQMNVSESLHYDHHVVAILDVLYRKK